MSETTLRKMEEKKLQQEMLRRIQLGFLRTLQHRKMHVLGQEQRKET